VPAAWRNCGSQPDLGFDMLRPPPVARRRAPSTAAPLPQGAPPRASNRTPEIHGRPRYWRCIVDGRSPENLAIGQAVELFSLGALFENCRSSRWVTGQYAGGDIECLTGSHDRMRPMCNRSPALRSPARNCRVMDLSACLAQRLGHAPRAGIFDARPDGHCLFRCDRFG
jgi:hypothetical protein